MSVRSNCTIIDAFEANKKLGSSEKMAKIKADQDHRVYTVIWSEIIAKYLNMYNLVVINLNIRQ